jgi:hypothetical protein
MVALSFAREQSTDSLNPLPHGLGKRRMEMEMVTGMGMGIGKEEICKDVGEVMGNL